LFLVSTEVNVSHFKARALPIRNTNRFSDIVKAYEIIKNPEKRAQYDVRYKNYLENDVKLANEANDKDGLESNFVIQKNYCQSYMSN
jgi:curved DNA-binding protein CbpA